MAKDKVTAAQMAKMLKEGSKPTQQSRLKAMKEMK